MNSLRVLKRELSSMRNNSFEMLIFFVTGRCNAKCHHCFYWENLGPTHVGLSLEKIEKVAHSMPNFGTLLLSGGEPTLRSDLPEIIKIFRRNNNIRNVSVPTNGLLPERIADLAERIAQIDPEMYVTFNLSIDGFSELHDQIRGVPGNYDSAMKTLRKINELEQDYPNLRTYVNSVICADNLEEIVPFANFVREERLADAHYFEIIRGDPPEVRLKAVPPEKLSYIYESVTPIQEYYLSRDAKRRRQGLMAAWRYISDVGNLLNKYRHQWRIHSYDTQWDFTCMAGESIGVIDYNGQTRICELREDNVNLADFDYDFSKAWDSVTLRREATIAKTHTCDCTHTCFINTSMRQDFSARFWDAPWLFFKYKIGKIWKDEFTIDSYYPHQEPEGITN
ncbi:MAG: radical SAM protein [Anaerolineae bacterium]|nr:radical SAM protein [Anaerolineae bacterium]